MTASGYFKPFLLLALLALPACAQFGSLPVVPFKPQPQQEGPAPEYVIETGDTLDIKFFYSPEMNDNVTVRPDGRISLQLVDDVVAAGLTPNQLDEELTALYSGNLPDTPSVSVIVKGFGDSRVYVVGEVATPGELALKNKMNPFQAVAAAGGFRDTASKDTVLVIRQDGEGNSAVMQADLSDSSLADSSAGAFAMLMPRDIVYVPKSGVAKADLFVDQHIRQLLLFNGFSMGVSGVYELNNKDVLSGPNN